MLPNQMYKIYIYNYQIKFIRNPNSSRNDNPKGKDRSSTTPRNPIHTKSERERERPSLADSDASSCCSYSN